VSTFSAVIDTTGECAIPEVFGNDFRALAAALDWARVFEGAGNRAAVGPELRAAARAARALADRCENLAEIAETTS
jgi:hypothetical protein